MDSIDYFLLLFIGISTVSSLTLEDDPSLWPGHLEPFGHNQKFVYVEEFSNWPSPTDFFKEFVDKSKPAIFRGLAKHSPAFMLWDDDYLKNHPGSDSYLVYVEPEKKENRTREGKTVTLKNFIEIYKNESIYMVHGVPKIIQKDVLMPPPLRCHETRKYMYDAVTWFSSGGTRSVVHFDDLDNVNCLLRGSKKLIFVNHTKYKEFIPLVNGYSPLDVDKVNYTKYPDLRKVEYVKANMNEGDCLFIPEGWIHQVNSKANEKGQNIAVNIWFKHRENLRPENCSIKPENATLDKYYFKELERMQADIDGKPFEDKSEIVEKYTQYLGYTKKKRANFKTFFTIISTDQLIFGEDTDIPKQLPSKFRDLAKKLFNVLDHTQNGYFSDEDVRDVEDKDIVKEYEEKVYMAHLELVNLANELLTDNSSIKDEDEDLENPRDEL